MTESLRTWGRSATGAYSAASLLFVTVLVAAGPVDAQDRHWLPAPQEVAAYPDTMGDLFGNPARIVSSPRGGFVLDDWAEFSVREFSPGGRMLWRFGRFGRGPGEFTRPLDFEFDEEGALVVLDEVNGLAVIDPDGSLVDTHRVFQGRQVLPRSFEPDPSSWPVMPRYAPDTLWVSRGSGRHLLKPSDLHYSTDLAAWGLATPLPDRGAVVVFRWSSQLLWLNADGGVRAIGDGIEPITFPETVGQTIDASDRGAGDIGLVQFQRIDPKAIEATTTQATVDGDRVIVLFKGATEHSRRLLDTYDIGTGEYLGSHLLPHPVLSVAILEDGRLATLEKSMVPTVRLWSLEGPS